MEKIWKVRVVGSVTRMEGKARVAVPRGDYTMRELELERYELTRDGGPTFPLTIIEVATYSKTKDLKIVEPTWP